MESSSSGQVKCEEQSDSTRKDRCVACRAIELEPVLFIQNAVSQMVYLASQDLMVEKACEVNHDLSPSVCSDLSSHDKMDEIVQDQVSQYLMYRDIFEASIKLVVVLFVGPWSDKWGRRFPLMLCLALLMLESAMMLINARQQQWPLEMMLLSSVFYGLSGGQYALLMLSFSHTAHISTTRRRTFRIGFLDTFWYFGRSFGLALKPVVQNWAGYGGVFGTAIVLYVCTILYVFLRLRNESYPNQSQEASGRCCCEQCSLDHIRGGLSSISRKRPHKNRLHILLLVTVMILDAFAASGEANVRYLFVTRAADWTSTHYSYWSSLSSILSVIGGFILVPVLALWHPIPDAVIGILGASSRLLTNACYAPVKDPSQQWLLYLGAVLGVFTVLAPVSVRSLLSKITKHEIGSIFGTMAAGETLITLASGPVYTSIYSATNEGHPGAYNLLSMTVHGVMIGLFGFVFYSMKRNGSLPKLQ